MCLFMYVRLLMHDFQFDFQQNVKLSKKAQAEKEDHNKRRRYNECRQADNG